MPTGPTDSGAMATAYLGLGSNLGDRRLNLEHAVDLLRSSSRLEVVRASSWIETEPVGGPPQERYLNGALEVRTHLGPRGLLDHILAVEDALGRVRTVRWGPRTIDIDLLFHGEAVVAEPDLEVPHPRILERAFVLEPLAEIAPHWKHPVTGRTVLEHLQMFRSTLAEQGRD